MLVACFAGSVSGLSFCVEILPNVGDCLLHFLESLTGFCGVPVFDAANVCTDSTEEVLFVQHHEMDFLGAKLSGDAGLRDGDLGAILEEVTRGLFGLHCVACVVCSARVVVSLA